MITITKYIRLKNGEASVITDVRLFGLLIIRYKRKP